MIDNSSTSISADKVPVQVDSTSVNKANISRVSETETVTPEQVVSEAKKSAVLSHEKVEEAVASLNAFVQLMDRNVSFAIDEDSGRDVISVYEKETKELIRQIPSEETLELLKRMDNMVGVLFSENV